MTARPLSAAAPPSTSPWAPPPPAPTGAPLPADAPVLAVLTGDDGTSMAV